VKTGAGRVCVRKGRLEAFSDCVFSIIITVMLLNLRVPQTSDFQGLVAVLPLFLGYLLSYVYVGIYWNNHHHLFQAAEYVSGSILWSNLHLLFWLSFAPLATSWMGQNYHAPAPVAFYGFVLLLSGIAYYILTRNLVACHGKDSALAMSVGHDTKGRLSVIIYALAIPLAFVSTWVAFAGYIFVAIMWLLPDPRIEKVVLDGIAGKPHVD
jgi:uncharacterized membrane protein